MDTTFGFATSVEEAIKSIRSADVEAEGAEYGIGLVRLMGKRAGFLCSSAALSSLDVNVCIVPEIHFQLYGKHGVYEKIIERAKLKGHCIVVIAEGAF